MIWHSDLSQLRFVKTACLIFLFLISGNVLFAQTTGKLMGRIIDENGNPLLGASVVIEDTKRGGVSDMDGYYYILNLHPGVYSVRFQFIGYASYKVEQVRISADQTRQLDAKLVPITLQGSEIVVIAKKPVLELNQTSSISSINKDDIKNLPVQSLTEIVNLQAGVVEGHFRGGRLGEVQYQIDGVSVNNPFNNASMMELDRSVIDEVQVISGTFDAKYGQAMSGVVNAILKSGSSKFDWALEMYSGDYYSTDKVRYPHNSTYNPFNIFNIQASVSGPTGLPKTTFFMSGRKYRNDGWLFGERRFQPGDKNDLQNRVFHPSGDGKIVAMSTSDEWSGQAKIANQTFDNFQLSYQISYDYAKRKNYNHSFRFEPDGVPTTYQTSLTHGLSITHTLSNNFFYRVNVRHNYFDYKSYVFENLYDPLYLLYGEPKGDANYELGANVQGVDLTRYKQKTNSAILKAEFTWQVDRENMIEWGIEGQTSEIVFGPPGFFLSLTDTVTGAVVLKPYNSFVRQPGLQTYYPKQLAAYGQDRIEIGDLVIRAGLRWEYFDANSWLPSDLQNPANTIKGAPLSHLKKTTAKNALAPRFGLNFPLTDASSVYFSYGHFYQLPGLNLLYSNADYSVLDQLQAGGISYGVMGNPDLNPELTVQYEFGFKQTISNNFGAQISLFFKDIRDLLGVEFVSTYAAADYARFTNIDFGSVSGFTVSLFERNLGYLSSSLDYTLEFAQGNSSDPQETANRAAAGADARPKDVPFNWDQRHTLNATFVYSVPDEYSFSTIIRFGTGQPYTPEIGSGFNATQEPNSGRKDSYVLVDLRGEKYFTIGPVNLSLFARIFNLLGTHSANGFVFNNTGSPDYVLYSTTNSTLSDPSRFYQPRRLEIGFSVRGL